MGSSGGRVTSFTEHKVKRFIDAASSAFDAFLVMAQALWLGFCTIPVLEWASIIPKLSPIVKGLSSLVVSLASLVVILRLAKRYGSVVVRKRFYHVNVGMLVGLAVAWGVFPATWPGGRTLLRRSSAQSLGIVEQRRHIRSSEDNEKRGAPKRATPLGVFEGNRV